MQVVTWLAVWTRAVVAPAWRRAAAVWVGAGIGGGIVFGPTGVHPRDLTRLALGVPAVGLVLAAMWLLVFVPTARVVVRADGATFLRSLPGPRWAPGVVGAVAIVVLQLPWLLLWLLGDGVRGLALVVGLTLVIAAIATWRPRVRRVRWPQWQSGSAALRGVYVRALRRRASDAIVRGVGLAILAGLAAALIVRNNDLAGESAAVLGSGVIAIVLLPGWVGALLPLVEAQRAASWLASSLGISNGARIVVLATLVVGVYLAGTLVALAAGTLGFIALFDVAAAASTGTAPGASMGAGIDASPMSTLAWCAGVASMMSVGIALVASRVLAAADGAARDRAVGAHDVAGGASDAPTLRDVASTERAAPNAAVRVVSGTVTASALAVLCLGWLGVAGVGLLVAIGLCALLTARTA